MLLQITNLNKTLLDKQLYNELNLIIEKGEKSALIGQNGTGKSTLFRIITGQDSDWSGQVEIAKGTTITMTAQEHHESDFPQDYTALEYILSSVPNYNHWKKILDNGQTEATVTEKYIDTLGEYTDAGYFTIEDEIVAMLEGFGIELEKTLGSFISLSGGEKRFVELTKVIFSQSDLILIDEPTNHLDYVGKQLFIDWVKGTDKTVLIITHDRDVLAEVNKIYDLKGGEIHSFTGNYHNYLKQNMHSTVSALNKYETDLARIEKLKKQANDAKEKKLSAKSNKGRLQAKILEERMKREYREIKENMEKPSFWLDKESIDMVDKKVESSYERYKDRTIQLNSRTETGKKRHAKRLFVVDQLVLGYDEPLFTPIGLEFYTGERVQIIGRNGAGKSTFLQELIAAVTCTYPEHNEMLAKNRDLKDVDEESSPRKTFAGELILKNPIRLGVYEQEVSPTYMQLSLPDAIGMVLGENGHPINPTEIKRIMKQYLFEEKTYETALTSELSGGEKARFQMMKMFMNKPNLLILDEPTNHLDLPSIEVIERFLEDFDGGVIFVSHDSFFSDAVGERREVRISL